MIVTVNGKAREMTRDEISQWEQFQKAPPEPQTDSERLGALETAIREGLKL